MQNLPPSDPALDAKLRQLVASHQRFTGKALIPHLPADDAGLRAALWNAPFAIVAHGTEADPIFFYGNRYALEHFEMSFADFTRLPSRLSAEPVNQESREKSLRMVAEQGYIDGYSGMRISSSGRRFMISQCTIWNIVDAAGTQCGQAAVFVA